MLAVERKGVTTPQDTLSNAVMKISNGRKRRALALASAAVLMGGCGEATNPMPVAATSTSTPSEAPYSAPPVPTPTASTSTPEATTETPTPMRTAGPGDEGDFVSEVQNMLFDENCILEQALTGAISPEGTYSPTRAAWSRIQAKLKLADTAGIIVENDETFVAVENYNKVKEDLCSRPQPMEDPGVKSDPMPSPFITICSNDFHRPEKVTGRCPNPESPISAVPCPPPSDGMNEEVMCFD